MNELDLFRNFRRGIAPPSSDAKGRASARLAGAVAGAHMPSTRRRRLGGLLANAGGRRRRILLLAATGCRSDGRWRGAGTEGSAGQLYRFERRYGGFSRAIGLPQGVSEEQISARYDNGELEVHVKKPEVEMPHRIQIGNGKAAIGTGKAAIEGKTTKA
jgi:Hsp20/alpha crystallin family protein